MSVSCVLVTPKRKLAGHLAVMKSALHFFGEFLVEGTGGSSVFKNFHASSNSDLTKSDQKQKFLKWPNFDLVSEKGVTTDYFDPMNEDVHQKQLKNVKRHRRWNIGKVWEITISISFCSYPYFSHNLIFTLFCLSCFFLVDCR